QELNDDVHIDRQAVITGAGESDHRGPQRLRVKRDPVGRLLVAAVADRGLIKIVDRLFGPDRNDVARSNLIAGARHFDAVDVKMAMNDSLAGLRPGLREAGAANDIIQPPLTDRENLFARVSLLR